MIDTTSQPKQSRSPVAQQNYDFSHTRILLAEDNEDNQRYISTLLKSTRADFDIAGNGIEAVNMATENNYDLVLMDIQMPEMNGLEATEKLRAQNFNKPIIALTANHSSSDIDTYIKGGCNAHIAKPIDRQSFFETIYQHLKQDDIRATAHEEPAAHDNFEDEIAKAINMFIQRLPGNFTAICEQYEARNKEKLQELIHDLKGTSGNFGYDKLFELAKEMEHKLKDDLLDEFGNLLHEAEKTVQSIILHPEQSSIML